jgi:Spy/CpxP family protein refolding chaperone
MQELSEKLNLTDAQKTAIELIVANEAKEVQEIRENSRKQINAILTPEQQKEFAEIKSEARHRMREHAGDRLKMLAEKLNLTDAQTAAIKPIFATEANDIKAVWQDNSLSKEQKQSKTFDVRETANEKINTILTPEQQAKWAELKEHARWMHPKGMHPGHKPFGQPPPPPPSEKQEPADSNS